MTQNEFMEKYKGREIKIETFQVNETPMHVAKVGGKALSEDEQDLFWTLYAQSTTIYSDPNVEVVKF